MCGTRARASAGALAAQREGTQAGGSKAGPEAASGLVGAERLAFRAARRRGAAAERRPALRGTGPARRGPIGQPQGPCVHMSGEPVPCTSLCSSHTKRHGERRTPTFFGTPK